MLVTPLLYDFIFNNGQSEHNAIFFLVNKTLTQHTHLKVSVPTFSLDKYRDIILGSQVKVIKLR